MLLPHNTNGHRVLNQACDKSYNGTSEVPDKEILAKNKKKKKKKESKGKERIRNDVSNIKCP